MNAICVSRSPFHPLCFISPFFYFIFFSAFVRMCEIPSFFFGSFVCVWVIYIKNPSLRSGLISFVFSIRIRSLQEVRGTLAPPPFYTRLHLLSLSADSASHLRFPPPHPLFATPFGAVAPPLLFFSSLCVCVFFLHLSLFFSIPGCRGHRRLRRRLRLRHHAPCPSLSASTR